MGERSSNVSRPDGGYHVSIQIRDLSRSIKGKLDSTSPSTIGSSCYFYRVHEKFRRINEYAYTPEIVSIGPFHHGKESLQAMEEHKRRYVKVLLSRSITPHDTKLVEYVKSLKQLEDEARNCYSEPINLNSDQFIEMLLIDGLFIIELFCKSAGVVERDKDDLIFKTKWVMASLVRDMMLYENQLPMLVLECLFKQLPRAIHRSLTDLALHFFNPLMQRDETVLAKFYGFEGKHLLDLFGNTFHNFHGKMGTNTDKTSEFIPSVMELRRCGIKFKEGNNTTGSFLDISFNNGVLEIPAPLFIQDQTESLFRNLIAWEQYDDGPSLTNFTSYVFLMDKLINSPKDVEILREKGIIKTYLGHDEEVSSLFNNLCCEVTLANFQYSPLCDKVNAYYKTRWHEWQAILKRNYFDTPWAILSFLAAILFLVLTFTQTTFSVLSFSHGKS